MGTGLSLLYEYWHMLAQSRKKILEESRRKSFRMLSRSHRHRLNDQQREETFSFVCSACVDLGLVLGVRFRLLRNANIFHD